MLLCYSLVVGVDKLHDFRERSLESAVHSLRKLGGRTGVSGGVLARSSLLGDVAVGEYHNHRLCLALGNQVVENLGSTAEFEPGILISSDSVKDIKHRVAGLAARVVACRGVNAQPAVKSSGRAVIPYLCHCSVRNILNSVEVSVTARHDEGACH